MIFFKDATIPVDVADGGGVTGYAATGSSPRARGAGFRVTVMRLRGRIIPATGGSSSPQWC